MWFIVIFEITKSCNLSSLWVSIHPSCVEVIIVVVCLVPIPLCVEVIIVWLSALSLLCEVIVVVPSLLCRGCFVGERSCVLLSMHYQILGGGSLCGRSYVNT